MGLGIAVKAANREYPWPCRTYIFSSTLAKLKLRAELLVPNVLSKSEISPCLEDDVCLAVTPSDLPSPSSRGRKADEKIDDLRLRLYVHVAVWPSLSTRIWLAPRATSIWKIREQRETRRVMRYVQCGIFVYVCV